MQNFQDIWENIKKSPFSINSHHVDCAGKGPGHHQQQYWLCLSELYSLRRRRDKNLNFQFYAVFMQLRICCVHAPTPLWTTANMMTSPNGSPFLHYWSFLRWIHRSPMNSPYTLMILWCGFAWAGIQTVEWPVILDYMTLMWRHRNDRSLIY